MNFKTFVVMAGVLLCVAGNASEANGGDVGWRKEFDAYLKSLTEKAQGGNEITKDELYTLGRYFIRNELERKCAIIEEEELQVDSTTVVLKAVYAFFNYSNPVGRELDDEVPGFNADLPTNETMRERWEALYLNALEDDLVIFDYGEQLATYQIYELGRCMFLSFFHCASPPFDYVADDEWVVLRSAMQVICYLNVPENFDATYAPECPVKGTELVRKTSKWRKVEDYLRENAGILGFGDGVVSFLTGTPRSWAAFEKRLEGAKWKPTARGLATRASELITKAAALYTDDINETKGVTQDQLFSNYISPGQYAKMIPPAISIKMIESLGESDEMSARAVVDHMQEGFVGNGLFFSLFGWRGLAEKFGGDHNLSEFQDQLILDKILLVKADLGDDAELSLQIIIDSENGEALLGDYFTENSVFALF